MQNAWGFFYLLDGYDGPPSSGSAAIRIPKVL